ncbi:MAG TPA: hypothetical protein VNN77_05350 [candidate division Zixibacteria bacterium]|nr:hypothetical protein [candidate division Zixibacteria bacterium]
MTKSERDAYNHQLRAAAKRLGLPLRGDIESNIIRYCKEELGKWIAAHGQPETLTELLELVTASLNLDIKEVRDEIDLNQLLRNIPPAVEPGMALLATELDDQTDAVILQRQHHQAWERPFLAVINCRGWHALRRYFSKWHEVVHLILDGKQLRFAFRRTPSERREPEEVLVDRIAGVLAFYPGIFEPAFRREIERAGRLSFDMVDAVRKKVAPEASRYATLLACLRHCDHPVYFVRAKIGYKRNEEKLLADYGTTLFPKECPLPKPKLRVHEVAHSHAVEQLGIRIHKNMEIPQTSVVATALRGATGLIHRGGEKLESWRTSSTGPIGYGEIEVEAFSIDEEVWALIHLREGIRGRR